MKKLRKYIVYLFITGMFITMAPLPVAKAQSVGDPSNASVGASCSAWFLTFPAWYNGVVKPGQDGGCDVISPSEARGGFSGFIWRIVLNLVEILLHAVGYLSVAFIIYGGIKYIYSAGSPNGMMGARKTIMNAIVGLILSIVSVAIVNTIAGSL